MGGLDILELPLPVFGVVLVQQCDESDVLHGKSGLLPPVLLGPSADVHRYCGVANAL